MHFLRMKIRLLIMRIFIHTRFPDIDLEKIKSTLQMFSFVWTMINIEHIVQEINVPEIKKGVDAVVCRQSTPAYDLVGYSICWTVQKN